MLLLPASFTSTPVTRRGGGYLWYFEALCVDLGEFHFYSRRAMPSSRVGGVVVLVTNNGVGNLTERSGGSLFRFLTVKGCGLQVRDVGTISPKCLWCETSGTLMLG